MFQFAFERALFRFKQERPTRAPLLQLPPAIVGKASIGVRIYPLKYLLIYFSRGAAPPHPPLRLRRNRFFVREGRAEVPARIREGTVQSQARRTDKGPNGAIAARERIISLAIVEPESIRPVCRI